MKNDLDHLMQANGIDALLITGPGQHNPPMVYLTGGAHMTSADLIQKCGGEAVLYHYPMERDEAARAGLRLRNIGEFNMPELVRQAGGDMLAAMVERYRLMLTELGITSGRVALYGRVDAGTAHAVFSGLEKAMPGLEVVGLQPDPLLMMARATKDEAEIERIRHMGRITTGVVERVRQFLMSHRAKDEVLVQEDGSPLTIGDVKQRINLWLAEAGAENPEGTIFAIGRDAGVPHSTGNPSDPMRLGQTIVFDIFPCEPGGGYYYDFTRTWCLGYAPEEAQQLYDQVKSVYKTLFSEMKAGANCRDYQARTCQLFEEMGHPTIASNPQTQEGYVHSLGHGLGLQVHERPMFSAAASNEDTLRPGVVITLEPGLYYPERGLGVRLEDTLYVRPDGQIEVLVEYPMELVVPIQS